MFSDTARHQHSQQPVQSLPPFVPADNRVGLGSESLARNGSLNHPSRSFLSSKPSSYPYPRPTAAVAPSQMLHPKSQLSVPENAEHMLRRKTPNGTLAAGYDGTPVEWTERSHAHKHILLPAANPERQVPYTNSPDELDHRIWVNRFGASTQAEEWRSTAWKRSTVSSPEGHHPRFLSDRDHRSHFARPQWAGAPSLDSMLHQAPAMQQPFYPPAGFHPIPTVLQPMWPPSVGPTTSNPTGPYGPYWPNGSFEPYRPAAIRDVRFDAHGTNINENNPSDAPAMAHDVALWSSNDGRNDHRKPDGFIGHGQWVSRHHDKPPADDFIVPLEERAPLRYDHANTVRDGSEAMQLVHRDPSWYVGAPTAQLISPLSPERNHPPTNNLQFKEKVLVWAHRIYLHLLASIHQARKHHHHKHQGSEKHASPPCIFPRPSRFTSAVSHGSSTTERADAPFGDDGHAASGSRHGAIFNSEGPAPIGGAAMRVSHKDDLQWPYTSSHVHALDHHGRRHRSANHRRHQSNQLFYDHHPSQGHAVSTPMAVVAINPPANSPTGDARAAIEMLDRLSQESGWEWTDGMLLGGCLAYGLGEFDQALEWYARVLACNPNNVEAISNTAAAFSSLNRRQEAEQFWLRSVKLRPSYFEAVEHLVGLLCGDQRGREAVKIIGFVERSLKISDDAHMVETTRGAPETRAYPNESIHPAHIMIDRNLACRVPSSSAFATSGYRIPDCDNGRLVALIHAKGNMLYALGDNAGAAQSFEDAIMIGAGRRSDGIAGLIQQILRVFNDERLPDSHHRIGSSADCESILLLPDQALKTASRVFPPHGQLPGLRDVAEGQARRAAIATTSNSLLSLAKIYQDGMSAGGATASGPKAATGVHDILALYYLSLSLQPSPSTANNVGILLASVQQPQSVPVRTKLASANSTVPVIPGVLPGSGIALALAYYNYGLNLDARHAHLYTNLGSLLKDIGQLTAAIKMYEQAVQCDGYFDIALANLANAVKDQGRIKDAIVYYERAVQSNPDFAEAVCGLANALNSVCCWTGRGGMVYSAARHDRWHVDGQGMLVDAKEPRAESFGWISRVVAIVAKQLNDGRQWGRGILRSIDVDQLLDQCDPSAGGRLSDRSPSIRHAVESWAGNDWEGARVVRLVERATKRLGWQLFQDKYIRRRPVTAAQYARPQLPAALTVPSAPTVLPFHTFTCPLTAMQIRKISQRNGLRTSCATLRAPWLPSTMYEPPRPPQPALHVGYVSSDFNNHPLAHLMQSVFGLHDPTRVKAFCYATTASDHSVHRQQIEAEAPAFRDASSWPVDQLVQQIVADGIHILINLNGYTRGARNEVFAARPAPIQMSFMGFAGTLGAEWCDYILADTTSIPPSTLRPWRMNLDVTDQIQDDNDDDMDGDWVYSENIIYTRDTFFCCDHRQSAPDSQETQLSWPQEQQRRRKMRQELFPDLPEDVVILGNFNQLYKIEPTTFRTWLRILMHVPQAVLWLLRFPELGEENLRSTAQQWAGDEVASRIIFTDVAPKHQHIARARVCDLFLDTPECNAHTTAADVLWSGTPLLTYPRYEYKMCSRMAASILKGALPKNAAGDRAAADLIVGSDVEYEERAVELGAGLVASLQQQQQQQQQRDRTGSMAGAGECRLTELRKLLYESRWTSGLFDTRRWVRDLEEAYGEAWRRWEQGVGGDIWLTAMDGIGGGSMS